MQHSYNVYRLGDQRVEWMYQGGFAAQEDADKRKEEYLLGKTVEKLPDQTGQEEAPSRVHFLAINTAGVLNFSLLRYYAEHLGVDQVYVCCVHMCLCVDRLADSSGQRCGLKG